MFGMFGITSESHAILNPTSATTAVATGIGRLAVSDNHVYLDLGVLRPVNDYVLRSHAEDPWQ